MAGDYESVVFINFETGKPSKPARKQVLIVDACSSGKTVEGLSAGLLPSMPSTQHYPPLKGHFAHYPIDKINPAGQALQIQCRSRASSIERAQWPTRGSVTLPRAAPSKARQCPQSGGIAKQF
jgi:hypothetical protein